VLQLAAVSTLETVIAYRGFVGARVVPEAVNAIESA
jgi:hypothetical protein